MVGKGDHAGYQTIPFFHNFVEEAFCWKRRNAGLCYLNPLPHKVAF